ncbi:hypothetical protein MMC25_006591 [Agyrium rufum]|nr:hypothetical protein [Agyrium rufum]
MEILTAVLVMLQRNSGKVLGGLSAINAQAFIAPSKVGMEAWNSFGNSGWDWDTMAPCYKKFHTLTAPPSKEASLNVGIDYIDEKVHGTSGPIQASFTGEADHTLGKAWVETFGTLGYGSTGDQFSGLVTGGFTNPQSIHPVTRTRSYSANAYYLPAKNRTNFVRATGVTFSKEGKSITAKARKEVILAAGTFNSPKLLELSGIGKKSVLQSHGIEAIVENDYVGENLQDHLMSGISFEVKDGIPTLDNLKRQDLEALQVAMTAYGTNQSGPFGAGAVCSFAFMPVVDFKDEAVLKTLLKAYPADASETAHPAEQVHYDFVRSVISQQNEGLAAFFMTPTQGNYTVSEAAKNASIPVLPGNYLTIGVVLLHPLSRGSTYIKSSDVTEKPIVDTAYLSRPLDVEIFARHLRFIEKIAATEPFASAL